MQLRGSTGLISNLSLTPAALTGRVDFPSFRLLIRRELRDQEFWFAGSSRCCDTRESGTSGRSLGNTGCDDRREAKVKKKGAHEASMADSSPGG